MSLATFLHNVTSAELSGFPLMAVMLLCFLGGALVTRLAIELDARALWNAVKDARKQESENDADPEGAEHE